MAFLVKTKPEHLAEMYREALVLKDVSVITAHGRIAGEGSMADLAGVTRTVTSPGQLQVYVQDAASFLPRLIHLADETGIALAAVTYKRPSLDDVFLLHTGHQLREA